MRRNNTLSRAWTIFLPLILVALVFFNGQDEIGKPSELCHEILTWIRLIEITVILAVIMLVGFFSGRNYEQWRRDENGHEN